jgi:hypothetical protein
MTALIANLPIKMVREEMPDLISLFGESVDEDNSVINADQSSASVEMDRSAEEALDAIAAKSSIKSIPENMAVESMALIAERTVEVTSKIRTAANKSQNSEVVEIEKTDEKIESSVTDDNSENDAVVNPMADNAINENLELEEQSNNQLELLMELPHLSESQEVVIEESPELYNQTK